MAVVQTKTTDVTTELCWSLQDDSIFSQEFKYKCWLLGRNAEDWPHIGTFWERARQKRFFLIGLWRVYLASKLILETHPGVSRITRPARRHVKTSLGCYSIIHSFTHPSLTYSSLSHLLFTLQLSAIWLLSISPRGACPCESCQWLLLFNPVDSVPSFIPCCPRWLGTVGLPPSWNLLAFSMALAPWCSSSLDEHMYTCGLSFHLSSCLLSRCTDQTTLLSFGFVNLSTF